MTPRGPAYTEERSHGHQGQAADRPQGDGRSDRRGHFPLSVGHGPVQGEARRERELKRLLALSAATPNRGHSMLGPMDNLWHCFILLTHLDEHFHREVASLKSERGGSAEAPPPSSNKSLPNPVLC